MYFTKLLDIIYSLREKKMASGLAWWLSVTTIVLPPPANAGDLGLIPDPGRSHMPWSN